MTKLSEISSIQTSFGLEGIGISYLRQLQDYLGFECSRMDKFKPKDGFTGFINIMEKCGDVDRTEAGKAEDETLKKNEALRICRCDLGTGGWSHTSERYNRVEFLVPFVQENMQVVTRFDNTDRFPDILFFSKAFSWQVWLAIVFLGIAFIIVKSTDRNFIPETTRQREDNEITQSVLLSVLRSIRRRLPMH